MCLRSASEERQSFGERICDDLSEVILQYLSFEDKLRLECVSKQFQRTIFQKYKSLVINYKFLVNDRFSFEALESVLKKCPNINEIHFKSIMYWLSITHSQSETIVLNFHRFVELIVKYCRKLIAVNSEVLFHSMKIADNWTKLLEMIDSKAFRLYVDSISKISNVFTSLTSVKQLEIIAEYRHPLSSMSELKNLKRVSFNCKNNINGLEAIIENNKSLKSVHIMSSKMDSKEVFKHSSKLSDLVELKISHKVLFNKSIVKAVKRMARKCLKIKSISMIISVESNSDLFQAITSLKEFKGLKRLDLQINCRAIVTSLQVFAGFEALTHLSLNLWNKFTETALIDIALVLPKLRYLRIHQDFYASKWFVDEVSRLSNLEVIDILMANFSSDMLAEELIAKLRKNCGLIRKIKINCRVFQ